MTTRAKSKPADAAAALHRRYIAGNPEMERMLNEAREEYRVAERIYTLRTAAGLTQGELAKRVGTSRSVISRLEDANYEGHSMSMLQRIAAALGHRIEVRFVPARRTPKLPKRKPPAPRKKRA